jgi:hypothetical protein
MSATDLHKAIAEVKQQQELAALVAAVLQQLPAVAAPPAPLQQHSGCGCQHGHPAVPTSRSSLRPVAIGGAVVVGGCVLTAMFLAVALASVAVAVGALVAFLLVREVRKGGK